MPKLIIEDLSIGLDDNGLIRDSFNQGTQSNKLVQKGSLTKYSLCNPFISIGNLGLFTTVSNNNDNKIGTGDVPQSIGSFASSMPLIACRNTTNPSNIYSITETYGSSEEEPNVSLTQYSYIGQGEYPLASAGFQITGNNSVVYGYGTFVLARTASTGGSAKMYLINSGTNTDISSYITNFNSDVSLIPGPNEVLTPMIYSQTNALYILTNKYLSKILSTGSFVGQLAKAPIGAKFKAMLENNGKLWIASMFKDSVSSREGSTSFTNPTCVVYVWGYKYNTVQGFDATIYLNDVKHIIDFITLDGKPTIIGINSANKIVIHKYDGAQFKQLKYIGDTLADVIAYTSGSSILWDTQEMLISSTKTTVVPYNNGIAIGTDLGSVYWVGKINSSTDRYSVFQLFNFKTKVASSISLSSVKLIPSQTNLLMLAQSDHQGTSGYYIFNYNPYASEKAYSTISRIRFNDFHTPAGSVVTNVKLLINGSTTGITYADTELVKVTIYANGKNSKTFTDKVKNVIDRGYFTIPFNNRDAYRVGIEVETNAIGHTNLHLLPVLERIEIDYKQSTIK